MSEEKSSGLLLQAIPYLGNKKILKVLTESGLVTLMTSSKSLSSLSTPFVWAEWVYEKERRDIYSLKDGTLLDDLASLKEDYKRLIAAGSIAQDLLRTQLPGKLAKDVLALSLACLRKLPLFSEPLILIGAFRLKLLAAEGLLDPEENPLFQPLLLSRSFSQLASIPMDSKLLHQIDLFFEEQLAF